MQYTVRKAKQGNEQKRNRNRKNNYRMGIFFPLSMSRRR